MNVDKIKRDRERSMLQKSMEESGDSEPMNSYMYVCKCVFVCDNIGFLS